MHRSSSSSPPPARVPCRRQATLRCPSTHCPATLTGPTPTPQVTTRVNTSTLPPTLTLTLALTLTLPPNPNPNPNPDPDPNPTPDQVTTRVHSASNTSALAPALGESWGHACNVQLMLQWAEGEREARLYKGGAPGTARFQARHASGADRTRRTRAAPAAPPPPPPPRHGRDHRARSEAPTVASHLPGHGSGRPRSCRSAHRHQAQRGGSGRGRGRVAAAQRAGSALQLRAYTCTQTIIHILTQIIMCIVWQDTHTGRA